MHQTPNKKMERSLHYLVAFVERSMLVGAAS